LSEASSRCESGLEAAVDEADPAVGGPGYLLAVGDEDDGGLFPPGQGGEEIDNGGAGGGVQIAGGFVGEDDGGAMDKGASYGGALELAAGKLVGTVVSTVGELNGVEELASASTGGRGDAASEEERKEHIFFDCESGEKVKELEYEADFQAANSG